MVATRQDFAWEIAVRNVNSPLKVELKLKPSDENSHRNECLSYRCDRADGAERPKRHAGSTWDRCEQPRRWILCSLRRKQSPIAIGGRRSESSAIIVESEASLYSSDIKPTSLISPALHRIRVPRWSCAPRQMVASALSVRWRRQAGDRYTLVR